MRLKAAHRRKKRKLFGMTFPKAALDRLLLCNRFAASSKSYVTFSCDTDFGAGYYSYYQYVAARAEGKLIAYYFKGLFYSIKDRIMDRFGKPIGYTLQHWTSTAWDDDYEGTAHHYHILEKVKLGDVTLHRPTGHFAYWTDCDSYEKETEGFDEFKKLCSDKIEGKKRITENVPEKDAALAALHWLCCRYGQLPVKTKMRPRLKTRTYYFSVPVNTQARNVFDDESIPL